LPPRQEERREPLPPPIQLNLTIVPEEKGVESLARQIRLSGRAYPLFEIAALVLKKPERYEMRLSVIRRPDGEPIQPLFLCSLDETLWLSEQDAVNHVLDRHFATFYQSERIATDPPKGTYTFVAQCGMSGVILGPPNYHDYQSKLRKLHADRFARMPFEAFKSRIKIVKDEPVVKKWLDDQSWKTEYICLNVPEAIRLTSRDEVEKHFRQVHLPDMIKQVESQTLSGTTAFTQPCRPLQNLARRSLDDQTRFPLRVVNVLSQQFANHGLQFFKVNKTFTHVAVARPRHLDMEITPVSEGIRRIVEFIQATPNCTRRKLLDALAPASPADKDAPPLAEGEKPPVSPEAAAVTSSLHWLIHEGHVIEFANGIMELAKKPAPKPPPRAPAARPSSTAPREAAAAEAPKSDAASGEAGSSSESAVTETSPDEGTPAPEPRNQEETQEVQGAASESAPATESSAASEPVATVEVSNAESEPEPEPEPESEPKSEARPDQTIPS
jgi:hypothetical protein